MPVACCVMHSWWVQIGNRVACQQAQADAWWSEQRAQKAAEKARQAGEMAKTANLVK
jgi:hypothetical protein